MAWHESVSASILFANNSNQLPTKNWWENCLLILKLSIFLFKLLTGMGCLLFERAWVEMTVLPRFSLCHLRPVVCWERLWEYPVVCLPKLTTKCVNFNGKINFPSQQSSLRLGGFKTVGKSADDSDFGSFKLNCRSSLPYLLYMSQVFIFTDMHYHRKKYYFCFKYPTERKPWLEWSEG